MVFNWLRRQLLNQKLQHVGFDQLAVGEGDASKGLCTRSLERQLLAGVKKHAKKTRPAALTVTVAALTRALTVTTAPLTSVAAVISLAVKRINMNLLTICD